MIILRWNEEITLITTDDPEKKTDDQGFKKDPIEIKTTVYANKRSVGSTEFYKADISGQYVRMKFDIHTEEYSGQTQAEHEGKRYHILRTYEAGNGDITELTLSELPGLGGGRYS